MALGKKIKALREDREWSQEELAEKAGGHPITQGVISALEKRDSKKSSYAPQLAAALGVDLDELLSKSEIALDKKIKPNTTEINVFDSVPVVSWVTAGNFEDVADPYEPGSSDTWLPCPKKHGERTFALRVDGVSMENLGGKYSYSDGDIIFVDPSVQSENGSRVVVRLEGEKQATFKQLIIEGGKKYLKPLNPSWPDKIIPINGNATICGVVIGKWVEE